MKTHHDLLSKVNDQFERYNSDSAMNNKRTMDAINNFYKKLEEYGINPDR